MNQPPPPPPPPRHALGGAVLADRLHEFGTSSSEMLHLQTACQSQGRMQWGQQRRAYDTTALDAQRVRHHASGTWPPPHAHTHAHAAEAVIAIVFGTTHASFVPMTILPLSPTRHLPLQLRHPPVCAVNGSPDDMYKQCSALHSDAFPSLTSHYIIQFSDW